MAMDGAYAGAAAVPAFSNTNYSLLPLRKPSRGCRQSELQPILMLLESVEAARLPERAALQAFSVEPQGQRIDDVVLCEPERARRLPSSTSSVLVEF